MTQDFTVCEKPDCHQKYECIIHQNNITENDNICFIDCKNLEVAENCIKKLKTGNFYKSLRKISKELAKKKKLNYSHLYF